MIIQIDEHHIYTRDEYGDDRVRIAPSGTVEAGFGDYIYEWVGTGEKPDVGRWFDSYCVSSEYINHPGLEYVMSAPTTTGGRFMWDIGSGKFTVEAL